MGKWKNKKTYQEYLNDPDRLSLDREMAILRLLEDMEMAVLHEDVPEFTTPKDQAAYMRLLESTIRSIRTLTQAYKNLVATEHKKQVASNITVKIDVVLINQLIQVILAKIPDINTRRAVAGAIESFAGKRQLSSQDTVPDEDPTLLPLPDLSSLPILNKEPLPIKKYSLLKIPKKV